MNPVLRRAITTIPVVDKLFYWARRRYHELRTRREAKRYFVDYDRYVDALALEGDGTVDIRTVDGLTITIRRNKWDARVLQEIFLTKPYDRTLALSEGATVVDVGGYIGDFALYAASHLKAKKVVVYEPSPKNFALLQRNIAVNQLANRIIPVNKAIGTTGSVMMNTNSPDRDQVNVTSYGHKHNSELVAIDTDSLSNVLEQHHLGEVDLLKLDCEGAEYDIILSTPPDVLRRVRHIVFEHHEIDGAAELLEATRSKLVGAGFRLTKLPGDIVAASRQ
jgi:FkbM family methyltransferase